MDASIYLNIFFQSGKLFEKLLIIHHLYYNTNFFDILRFDKF